jgi:hypothetical protein
MVNKGLWKEFPIEFRCWSQMKQRCYNPNSPNYKYYGARGVVVCEQWLVRGSGFATFLEDMGARPTPHHSIERRNVEGIYEPANCYWATTKVQANNTRRSVYLKYGGKKQTLQQWSEELGIPYDRIRGRYRYGWPVEKILTIKKDQHSKERRNDANSKLYTYDGETLNLRQWSRRLGIAYEVLRARFRYGWSVERTFTTPPRK